MLIKLTKIGIETVVVLLLLWLLSVSFKAPVQPIAFETEMTVVSSRLEPVRNYAQWMTNVKHQPHDVFAVPPGSVSYQIGERYVAIPLTDTQFIRTSGVQPVER